MRLTVLGSGSPEAYVRRASSGYLIETGEDLILFDCGGGVVDNLLRSGRKPSDITHIFFSHLHSDHMMDYARLVHAAWDEGGAPVKVFGPTPIKAITEGYFGPEGVLAHDLRARTDHPASQSVWNARGGTIPRSWPAPEVQEIAPGASVKGDGWRVTCCEVPHVQPFMMCLGFALEADEKTFVYSGDSGACAALEDLARGADLLLHWCYRLDEDAPIPTASTLTPSPTEIAGMARRLGVHRLLLTHFRVGMDRPERFETALNALRTHFGEDAAVAEDLLEIEI